MLKNKKILIGVTGGIAAYKICSVVRLLKKSGAHVKVLMTPSATQFVTPLTFSALSQDEVLVSLWPESSHSSTNAGVKHIDLGLWADAMLIAPASANTIAKIAYGIADNAVTSTVLALRCPLLVAPSMDVDMYLNAATQSNIDRLKERGCFILQPDEGELASGLTGPGRLPEPETLIGFVESVISKSYQDLKGQKILVTAGPTAEPIDPVRYIGNRSSGKMGFALARAASLRGAEVTLISGPVMLGTPANVMRIDVERAEEMHKAVMDRAPLSDIIIMAAAVADFAPDKHSVNKIKKNAGQKKRSTTIVLHNTADILLELGRKKGEKILVGFALETENELENARIKLRTKNLDLIVLNSTRDAGATFGTDTNIVTIIPRIGKPEKLPLLSKFDVAMEILNRIKKLS
jgi:phosphopantothenoylcysteine decarboxylase/phosphopantothenate--cysteine ligase